jgi:hypothetical protein
MNDAIAPIEPPGLRPIVRNLIRGCNRAALATTLAGEQRPYVSLVTVATDVDGSPLLLLSRLADHTRNIDGDAQVSLLFDGTEGYANPQQGPRVTVVGRIEHCNDPRVSRRFLARHPGAALYAGFADFAFYRVALERIHWVGGFARAIWLDGELTAAAPAVAAFAEAEPALVEEINARLAPKLDLLAQRLLKRRGKDWKAVAVDPDGVDLAKGKTVLRLAFPTALDRVEDILPTLATLADGETSQT